MVTKELSKAATEVNIILKNSSSNVNNKIPQHFKEFLKKIEDKNYVFNYETNKTLNEQKISKLARGIITLIYKDYLCEDKDEYIKELQTNFIKQDAEKKEKYNPDNLFNKKEEKNKLIILNENKKENLLRKILNKIKKIFKRRGL